ncbi:hypothetical protein BH20ACT21_BH20ACT21_04610 [soil metagenome]
MLKKGRYLLNTDGGMKRLVDGQPGEAAIGVVLNEPGDRAFQIFRDRIGGPETIQGAEYKALIKGLELALEHGSGRSACTSTTSL